MGWGGTRGQTPCPTAMRCVAEGRGGGVLRKFDAFVRKQVVTFPGISPQALFSSLRDDELIAGESVLADDGAWRWEKEG